MNITKLLEKFDEFVKHNQSAPYTEIKQFIIQSIEEVLKEVVGKEEISRDEFHSIPQFQDIYSGCYDCCGDGETTGYHVAKLSIIQKAKDLGFNIK